MDTISVRERTLLARSKLDACDTATSTLDPMRILALLVLAVSVDALHAVHPAASVLLKPAIRARAQRHLLSASAVLSTGDIPGSAPQVERTRGTWLEQTRPTFVKTLSAYVSIILPVTLAARIAGAKVPASTLLVITQNLQNAARGTAPLLLLSIPLTTSIAAIVGPIAGTCIFLLNMLVMSIAGAVVPIMRTPVDVICSLLYGNSMHLNQAAREALLRSHAIGAVYFKLCGFISIKLNMFAEAYSGAIMAFAPWCDIALTFVVVGPIVEEVVFRHFLQRGLQRIMNWVFFDRCFEVSSDEADEAACRRKAAATTTHFLVSLAFALIHVLGPIGDVVVGGQSRLPLTILRQFVYTGLSSFFLYCPLFTKHGLPAAIAAHSFWNAISLAFGQRLFKL